MLCPQSSAALLHDPGLLVSLRTEQPFPDESRARPRRASRDHGTTVSLQEHPQLLRLLNSEPFRAELRAHPVAALAKHGIRLDPADVPDRVTLPELRLECVAAAPVWMGLLA